jgi:glycosyltransferase involved in cell wall biosynthesis
VLVISLSDLASDPRVDRQIMALRTRFQVVAAGLAPPAYDDVEFVDLSTPPLGVRDSAAGVARLLLRRHESAYWKHPKNRRVLERLRPVPADVVIANDVATLPIAAQLGRPIVLDAHEFAPEEFAERWTWRHLLGPYVRWQCRRYLPEVAAMMTVSEGFAKEYERQFGVRPTVVTNAPPYADLEPTAVREPVRILHHGAALPGRGLEDMVRLADLLDERFTLDFVLVEGLGARGFRDKLIAQAAHNPRVRFPPPVPMRELVALANGYDIGLHLLPPSNLSHRLTLPNKLFEFIQGRLAVVVGPSPGMATLVQRYRCGVVAPTFQAASLAAELNSLDAKAITRFKNASHRASRELCAERNAELILEAVEQALGKRG